MSGIQSSIGVITGIPIQDTVDQLIAISARPRDQLVERTAALKQQQVAIGELTALVIGVQLSTDNLGKSEIFDAVDVTSSKPDLVSTQVTGSPTKGSFSFQPVRQSQFHQLLSGRLSDDTEPLGAGTFSIRSGGFVDDPLLLEDLNGGQGVERGQIRITDRSGATAIVNLRNAASIRDVIETINNETGINVSASVNGDSLILTDRTGQTTSNLIVQQVGLATTAQDLGLSGINVAADSATGLDVVRLSESTRLEGLNDGTGVDLNAALPELEFTFRDNSAALQIDLDGESTLGELLETLNAADPARLQAQISADGDRIELIDLTADAGGAFSVSSLYSGTTAEDLGLVAAASGDTITGGKLQGGLGTVLLNSLGGGDGFGGLGQLTIQDRDGNGATVDLSGLETLDEAVTAINQAGIGITARINDSRNGLVLEDDSGGTGNLIVASGSDGLTTAEKLGITVDDAVDRIDSGSLRRQVVSNLTRLDDYNNGKGVDDSSFLITDSAGAIGAINLATEGQETVGDIIDAINALGIGVQASLNTTGDGIQLVDTAGGTGTLTVEESGNGTAAADLGIVGIAETIDQGSGPQQVIDGAQVSAIEVDDDDTLDDLIAKINDAEIGVSASKFFDGIGYRIALTSDESGRSGRFQIDGFGGLSNFSTLAEGQDALISVGAGSGLGFGVLVTNPTDTFDEIIEGVSFTIQGASDEVVTVAVTETDSKVVSNVKLFIEQYNKLREKLDELTSFQSNGSATDPSVSTGLLFGSAEALRIEQSLGDLVSGRLFGAGSIQSLGEIGIDVRDDGQLELNEEKLTAKYTSDSEAVREFFTAETFGVAAKFNAAVERLAGDGNSVLLTRNSTLQSRIDSNDERIARLTESLDRERLQLLKQFVTLESSIQKLQANQTALGSIQPLPPLGSVN